MSPVCPKSCKPLEKTPTNRAEAPLSSWLPRCSRQLLATEWEGLPPLLPLRSLLHSVLPVRQLQGAASPLHTHTCPHRVLLLWVSGHEDPHSQPTLPSSPPEDSSSLPLHQAASTTFSTCTTLQKQNPPSGPACPCTVAVASLSCSSSAYVLSVFTSSSPPPTSVKARSEAPRWPADCSWWPLLASPVCSAPPTPFFPLWTLTSY